MHAFAMLAALCLAVLAVACLAGDGRSRQYELILSLTEHIAVPSGGNATVVDVWGWSRPHTENHP